MKRNKISTKVIRLLLVSILSSMLLVGICSIWNLQSMKRISVKNSEVLGQTAAINAEDALETMAGENLLNVAVEKSAYMNEKFIEIENCVQGIASLATDIYRNPNKYSNREVPRPVKGSKKLAVQLLRTKELRHPTQVQKKEQKKLANIQDLLIQYNKNNNMISSTYLATETGWMIQADYIGYSKYNKKTGKELDFNAKTRQWYQKAKNMKAGQIVYTDVMRDFHEKADCIVCAAPVYRNGKVVAVAGVGSYLHTIKDAVLQTKIGKNGYALLINENGQILMSPKEKGELAGDSEQNVNLRYSRNSSLKNAANEMVTGKKGRKLVTIDGKDCYIAYAPLKSLNWSFVTVIDVEEILMPAKDSQNIILDLTKDVAKQQENKIKDMFYILVGLFFVIVIITGVVGVIFSYKLTNPIRQLAKEAAEVDLKDLNHRIQIHTGDEVEELGNAFNGMIEQIKLDYENISKVTADKERIRMEIQMASRLQADMLPQAEGAFPRRNEFTLASFMQPAKGVGGDFYDFFLLDSDHLAVIMADVSGKGVPAALFMVVARTVLRSYVAEDEPLSQAISKTNKYLCRNNGDAMFVTAWIGVLTISTGKINYVNAGHCPPVLKHIGKSCEFVNGINGLVLAGLDDTEYSQSELQLETGDTILLYTDGVTETTDSKEKLYGEEKLLRLLENMQQKLPNLVLEEVWQDVMEFQGEAEQFDDITMLVLCYNGKGFAEKSGKPQLDNLEDYVRFMENYISQFQVTDKTIVKLNIALDEIYSNICNYSKAEHVKVGCRVISKSYQGRKVVLQFQDDGIPYNPLEKPDPDLDELLEERPVGGLGIYLVKQQMDNVEYEYKYVDGVNVLTLTKNEEK